jgi:hypothetical protein
MLNLFFLKLPYYKVKKKTVENYCSVATCRVNHYDQINKKKIENIFIYLFSHLFNCIHKNLNNLLLHVLKFTLY